VSRRRIQTVHYWHVESHCVSAACECLCLNKKSGFFLCVCYKQQQHCIIVTVCGTATDVCEVAARCSGTAAQCPANGFLPSSMQCRAANPSKVRSPLAMLVNIDCVCICDADAWLSRHGACDRCATHPSSAMAYRNRAPPTSTRKVSLSIAVFRVLDDLTLLRCAVGTPCDDGNGCTSKSECQVRVLLSFVSMCGHSRWANRPTARASARATRARAPRIPTGKCDNCALVQPISTSLSSRRRCGARSNDNNPCTVDVCAATAGGGTMCQRTPASAGVACRASAGPWYLSFHSPDDAILCFDSRWTFLTGWMLYSLSHSDVAETCNGSSLTCPGTTLPKR
jgi:hypothetical protein